MQQAVINKVSLDHGIIHLILNRPQQLNALNVELLIELDEILDKIGQDKSIKGILLSGVGKAFCAGADIKYLRNLTGQTGLQFATFSQQVFRKLELLGKPSLAAIHGYALGGGLELAMAATLRMAAYNTIFGQPEIKLGLIPGFGGTQRLPRLIGRGRALDLCLTGRNFSAEEAFQWGLVNELTSEEALLDRAKNLLNELVQYSTTSLASIITLINQGTDMSLEEGLALEAAHFAVCCSTKDKLEGVTAFLEKRKAQFIGE